MAVESKLASSGQRPFDFQEFARMYYFMFVPMTFQDISWFYLNTNKLRNKLKQRYWGQPAEERHGVKADVSLTPISNPDSNVVTVVYGRPLNNDEYSVYRLMGMVVLRVLACEHGRMRFLINPLALAVGLTHQRQSDSYLLYTVALDFMFFKRPAQVAALCTLRQRLRNNSSIKRQQVDVGECVTKILARQKTTKGVSATDWLADVRNLLKVEKEYCRIVEGLPLRRRRIAARARAAKLRADAGAPMFPLCNKNENGKSETSEKQDDTKMKLDSDLSEEIDGFKPNEK